MVKDAQSHSTEARRAARSSTRATRPTRWRTPVEKTITENREKLSSQDVSRIETLIAEVRQAAQGKTSWPSRRRWTSCSARRTRSPSSFTRVRRVRRVRRDLRTRTSRTLKVVDGEYAEAS